MPDMNTIHRLLETLPDYMVACLESPEYAALFDGISEKFELTDEQRDVLEDIVVDVFLGDLALSDIFSKVRESFGFDSGKSESFARDIVGEFVIPFPHYFEDGADVLRILGGDEGEYMRQSALFSALRRFANEQVNQHIQYIRTLPTDQARVQFNHMIEKNLIDCLYGADNAIKIAMNNLAIDLLANVDKYHVELLHALYENKQTIGEGARIERDGERYPPLTFQWLKDFISYSEGHPSTIYIAQYMTQNKNVRQLGEKDKEVLWHVLEIYQVLKLFPKSLEHTPTEKWMIIPYAVEEASPRDKFSKEHGHSPPPDDDPPQKTSSDQYTDGTDVADASPLGLESHASSSTILPPELYIPELPAPSTSLHSFAPVAVQTQTAVAEKPHYEEIQYEFFIDQEPKVVVQENHIEDKKTDQQKKSFFSGKNYQELADEVLAMSGVAVSDPVLHARLQSIVITRLRNIRTAIEIRERLSEPIQRGGFGLDSQIADSITRSANMATDLLLQGVLKMQEIQQKQPSVDTDIREIRELVKREFTQEPKKFGRSRFVPYTGNARHISLPPPPLPVLPYFSEPTLLESIPILFKKPVPPPIPSPPPPPLRKHLVTPPQYSSVGELVPLSVLAPQKKKETIRTSPVFLHSQVKVAIPPVKREEKYVAIPSKLDTLPFRKALKYIPAVFSKKLSVQEVAQTTPSISKAEVSHKQPHSFFGATDMPHIQHASLPTFSIEEIDGVPMIIEKQKEKQSEEQIMRAEAVKREIQKKEEEEKARRRAQEQKAHEEEEKKKKIIEEQRVIEEKEKAQKALKDVEEVKKITKEQEAQIEALKKEIQKKEEEEKAKRRAQEQKAREEEEKRKTMKVAQEVQEVKKSAEVTEPEKKQENPSIAAMPQEQTANKTGGSLFSNIFHIPVSVKSTPQQPGKVSFSDVKASPRLINTIEELRIFTLKDFRRLSEDPMGAASRIYDKIQSLEKESFTKKLAAIAAWRESEINILYVQIGQEALLRGKSITSVIDQLKAEGKPYLTEQEFDAVLELNERIRM